MTCVESEDVTSRNTTTRNALVTISALPLAREARRTRITPEPVINPRSVQLLEDVRMAEHPIQPDRGDREAEKEHGRPQDRCDVIDDQYGRRSRLT